MPELGNKHTCYSCQTKFYDLGRDPICPKCQADQREGDSEMAAGRRAPKKSRKVAAKAKAAVVDDSDDSDETDSDDDAVDDVDDDADDDADDEEVGLGSPGFGDIEISDDDD